MAVLSGTTMELEQPEGIYENQGRHGGLPLQDMALLRLLQLASPALPVGAYCYSQGLERAIEDGSVFDQASASGWIHDTLHFSLGRFEAPVWWRLYHAWCEHDQDMLAHWNKRLCVARETAEFRAENLQMGASLLSLLTGLQCLAPERLLVAQHLKPVGFATVFSLAAVQWAIPPQPALLAYLWTWVENQVLAALKAVPLGQLAGQIMLGEIGATLPAVVARAMTLGDDELSNFAPALAIASSRHEMQYSRLFRS